MLRKALRLVVTLGLCFISGTAGASATRVYSLGSQNRFIVDDSNRWTWPHDIVKYGSLFYLGLGGVFSTVQDNGTGQPSQLFSQPVRPDGSFIGPEVPRGVAPQVAGGSGFVVGLTDDLFLHMATVDGSQPFETKIVLGTDNVQEFTVPGDASQFNGVLTPADLPTGIILLSYMEAGPLDNIVTNRTVDPSSGISFGPANVINTTGRPNGPLDVDPLPADNPGGASFIMTWASFGSVGDDASLNSIQARFTDELGVGLGAQLQVNTFTAGNQLRPRVAAADNGDFVVVWHSDGSPEDDNSLTSIQARRYNADGTPKGDQFQINQAIAGDQYQADVAVQGDGRFTVVWTDIPTVTLNVFARDYDAAGDPLIDQLQMNGLAGADSPQVSARGEDFVLSFRQGGTVQIFGYFVRVFASGFEGQ